MDQAAILALFRFNTFANESLRQPLLVAGDATARQPLDMWFGSVFSILAHVCGGEGTWLARLRDRNADTQGDDRRGFSQRRGSGRSMENVRRSMGGVRGVAFSRDARRGDRVAPSRRQRVLVQAMAADYPYRQSQHRASRTRHGRDDATGHSARQPGLPRSISDARTVLRELRGCWSIYLVSQSFAYVSDPWLIVVPRLKFCTRD